jgi:hypothetical protein
LQLRKFEKLLLSLDKNLMSGQIFELFLGQDFTVPGGQGQGSQAPVAVARNKVATFDPLLAE